MSERFVTEIRIGGTVTASSAQELCAAISAEVLPLDWGEEPFSPELPPDLLTNLQLIESVQVLRLCDEQARWGRFPELEAFLVAHDIPFDRLTEGGCGYDAERESFRPGCEPVIVTTTVEGKPLVSRDVVNDALAQLQAILASVSNDDVKIAKSLVKRAVARLKSAVPDRTPLPPFAVSP